MRLCQIVVNRNVTSNDISAGQSMLFSPVSSQETGPLCNFRKYQWSICTRHNKHKVLYTRVKHNNGSICKSLLLCGIISYLLLSCIGKLYINPCLNGWAMLSQNFSILAQTVSEI